MHTFVFSLFACVVVLAAAPPPYQGTFAENEGQTLGGVSKDFEVTPLEMKAHDNPDDKNRMMRGVAGSSPLETVQLVQRQTAATKYNVHRSGQTIASGF